MFKVIWLVDFNRSLGADEADAHWSEVHADLMRKVPGVERYVQNRWVGDGADGSGPLGFGLHSECWFADRAAYDRALASPEWQNVAADSPKCFELSTLVSGEVEERVVVG